MDTEETSRPADGVTPRRGPFFAFDVVVGVSSLAVARTFAVGRGATRTVAAALGMPGKADVDSWMVDLARRGEQEQDQLKVRLLSLGDDVVRAFLYAVLDRIDLTETVKRYVDVNSIVRDVDIDAVIEQLDLAGLAEGVIAEVDLAEIIRQSTGSLTADTVEEVRMQGIAGDEVIDRAAGRIRVRFSRKHESSSPARPADS